MLQQLAPNLAHLAPKRLHLADQWVCNHREEVLDVKVLIEFSTDPAPSVFTGTSEGGNGPIDLEPRVASLAARLGIRNIPEATVQQLEVGDRRSRLNIAINLVVV